MTQVRITTASYEDWPEIASIEHLCFPPKEAATIPAIQERLRTYPQGCLVARLNNTIIGFINSGATDVNAVEDAFYTSMAQHLENGQNLVVFGLDVHPLHQGQGYAKALMQRLIAFANQENKSAILLTCKEHLIDFYTAFGYKNLGPSNSNHGGAKWYDLQLDLIKSDPA